MCPERIATRKGALSSFSLQLNNKTTLYLSSLERRIQPHLPIRLPCYDFNSQLPPPPIQLLQKVGSLASAFDSIHGVTGVVYKTGNVFHPRHSDSRLLAIPASCSQVADYMQSELGRPFCGLLPLAGLPHSVTAIVARVSPRSYMHDDLTSSPPSSRLSLAVSPECPASPGLATEDRVALVAGLTQHRRHELTTTMHHLSLLSRRKTPLRSGRRMSRLKVLRHCFELKPCSTACAGPVNSFEFPFLRTYSRWNTYWR